MSNERIPGVVIFGMVFLVLMMGVNIQIHYANQQTQLKQRAVEAGAAYWCIEDHKKVFSFKPCDQRQQENDKGDI